MGKKGTAYESRDVPEALGIVSGTAFLISAIFSQLVFAKTFQQLMVFNSGLFSICFMIFLGFTDDTLDLKWRYKLILPTVASLPLLSAYSGSTAVFIPTPFRFLLWSEGGHLTTLGALIDIFATVDSEAHGAIIELGYLFLLFMGLLAVFCTNAINILAGVNGLECGQSYIIACSILLFKLYEISRGIHGDNQMFSVIMILPFIGTSLALLRHNWYPARVFVGDTFCYFAGMTFAVIGIHGHFSKTLLLLFLPQIFNFLYSIPQLFKFIPCPRHRLPKVDPATKLLHCSTFSCKASEYRWFKIRSDDLSCPNYTLICVVLRVFGPMRERTLTVTLLLIQSLSTAVAFYIRYFLLEERS
jgi:UDP-N-acetylglucosamine--dolichyl-phosphate N-acetylglucosaminephosphotransferase